MQTVLRSHFQFAFYLEVVVLTARYLILKEIASSVLYRVDHRFCPPNAAMLRTKHLRCQLTRTEEKFVKGCRLIKLSPKLFYIFT